jgi:hypothetical protein
MREVLIASFANVIVFASLACTATVTPEADRNLSRMFGQEPFGLPVRQVVFCVLVLLYLPLVPAVAGLVRLGLTRAEMQKAARSKDWAYFNRVAAYRPGAVRLALFGLVYFTLAAGGWIASAELKGW